MPCFGYLMQEKMSPLQRRGLINLERVQALMIAASCVIASLLPVLFADGYASLRYFPQRTKRCSPLEAGRVPEQTSRHAASSGW